MKYLFLISLVLLLFSGCSSKNQITLKPYKKAPKNETPSYTLKSKDPIAQALYEEYKKWQGTPYCYGGTSSDGVDCSGLVQRIFRDALGVKVPRETQDQARVGYKVPKSAIQTGDIIFFKTGWKTRHSAIYLERGNFINSSSTHGVILSNLNNPY